jgi:uncharacterized sulfatase
MVNRKSPINTAGYNRRTFLKRVAVGVGSFALTSVSTARKSAANRPNILCTFADDWSWPHASIGGDKVVKTPTFDRVARRGVLFTNAFVSAPSCTPSRGSVLTGQWHWRLEQGANLHSTLPAKFEVYPDILERAGYHVGFTSKGWGPGRNEPGGRDRNPAGPKYQDFRAFLDARPKDKPFCFWFGSRDPHRPYEWQSGVGSGMKIEDVEVPPCFPDTEIVRADICDYYWEIQRFDREVGGLLSMLEGNGELDNTLVVISGDNGMPFPRCKSNLYDLGTHVPLAICWPKQFKGGCVVEDFVSLSDLAPTFLEAAGLTPTADMTGRSILSILMSGKSGRIDPGRDKVFTGKERHHGKCREGGVGYPVRAIRTHDYLYIRNFEPARWPAGSPYLASSQGIYSDADKSPTKDHMLSDRNDTKMRELFEKAFGKRPAEELYDLGKDPGQMRNIASKPECADVKSKLNAALMAELRATRDPRVLGEGDAFDNYPYYGSYGVRHVKPIDGG